MNLLELSLVSNGHIVRVLLLQILDLDILIGSEPLVVFDAPLSYSNIPATNLFGRFSSLGLETQSDCRYCRLDKVQAQLISILETLDMLMDKDQRFLPLATRRINWYSQPMQVTAFKEFQLAVDRIDSDKFSAWHFGELERS